MSCALTLFHCASVTFFTSPDHLLHSGNLMERRQSIMMPSSLNVPQATTPPSQCEINSKGNFIAKHIYIEELEKFQIKNLTLCLKELGWVEGGESYTQIEQNKKMSIILE